MIWHREDANGDEDFLDAGDERWWHLTDTQFSTVAILDDAANLQERIKYDAYGKALHHRWRDVDGDRDYDSADRTIISIITIGVNNLIGQANYRAEADLDRDGDVDTADLAIANTSYESALAPGVLSDSTVKNTIGWDGYVFNPETTTTGGGGGLYTMRFRWYSTELGRWLTRDPVGHMEGMNLYGYASAKPLDMLDYSGLFEADPSTLDEIREYVDTYCLPHKRTLARDEYYEQWVREHPGLTGEQYKWASWQINRGCIGIAVCNLGTCDKDDGYPDMSNCFETLAQAEKHRREMICECACGEGSMPRIFSVHFWLNGGPAKGDEAGRGDMQDWIDSDKKTRPPLTIPEGKIIKRYVNYDVGWCQNNRIIHADRYHNPDENSDGFGDMDLSRPIRHMGVFDNCMSDWQNMDPSFSSEVWCVACDSTTFATEPSN